MNLCEVIRINASGQLKGDISVFTFLLAGWEKLFFVVFAAQPAQFIARVENQ